MTICVNYVTIGELETFLDINGVGHSDNEQKPVTIRMNTQVEQVDD